MNNIKIKLYKKEDLASLRKYKRLIIILSVTCLLLTIIIVASFCNKYIMPSIDTVKPLKINNEIKRKVITVEASDLLIDKQTPLTKKRKVIIQQKKPIEIYHIVEKGQTLYSISKMYNVNIDDIIELNSIDNNIIYLHESIIIKREIIENKSQLSVYGIDISHHQNKQIESITKQKEGIGFIICKATEGVTYIDPEFSHNWKISKNKSFIRGAYHFYRCEDDPIEQAAHFLKTISDIKSTDIPPILDFEEGGIDKSQSIGEVQSALKKFLLEIEKKSKVKPIIYTDVNTGNTYLNDSFFADYPLWIANYNGKETPDLPNTWISKGWVFWQKTDKYIVDGKTDDFDKFNGNLVELKEFIKQSHNK